MRLSLFWRLAAVLFLFFTVLRLEFLIWNRELFSEDSVGTLLKACLLGLRFDAAAIGWLMLPVLIWGWVVKRAYFIPVFLVMLPFWFFTAVDIELWNFFGRRMSLSVLKMFREADGKVGPIVIEYLPWILLGLAIASVFFVWLWRVCWKGPAFKGPRKILILEQIVIVLLLVVGMRGGFQKKPLTPVNAHLFDRAHLNQLVLNTPFTILKSLKGSGLQKEKHFETYEEAYQLVNSAVASVKVVPQMPAGRPNVVILILESFSWEYTALNPNLQKEYTPFLNSLMKQSLTFTKGMANGRRSIEGVAALMSGIPALMEEPFITSEFATNNFEGLGSIFARRGYTTSFFHGGDNGTMHFDAFTSRAGFQSYYGSREYPNAQDHDGVWGIWDRPYLQYYVNQLNQQTEPFMSAMFTLSSHQPYRVPEAEKERFPEQDEHLILKAVTYADSSLQDFFEKAKAQPWFENTLFVLVADHTGPVVFHRKESPLVAYRIPILFYHPKIREWPAEIPRDQVAQQIDIPASLFDLLGFENEKVAPLSRSLFRPGPKHYTAFAAGVYWHTDGTTILTKQGQQKSYSDFNNPIVKVTPTPQIAKNLEDHLKADQQVFSWGLWENKLYGP